MDTQEIQIVEVSPGVVYQQDKAQIDIQISTAKAYPRNIKRATENSIAVVTMDEQTASSCHYSLPRGNKRISGPSVHMARIIAQNWGNLRVESKIVGVEDKMVTSQAVAFDLENNLAIKVEVKRSIMTKSGRMNNDMIVVTGNAANAISMRNAILAVVPKAVVDKVYNAAKQVMTGDISDKNKLLKKRKQVFDTFKDDYDVSEKELLEAVGRSSVKDINAEDLVTLIGLGQAIRDGDTTVEEQFRSVPTKMTAKQAEKADQDEEQQRIIKWINEAKTIEQLEQLQTFVSEGPISEAYDKKESELKKSK